MLLEGTVQNGVIVPDPDFGVALSEGTRVRIKPVPEVKGTTFGELFADLIVDDPDLPTDLAAQHDHYRLGVPKR